MLGARIDVDEHHRWELSNFILEVMSDFLYRTGALEQ